VKQAVVPTILLVLAVAGALPAAGDHAGAIGNPGASLPARWVQTADPADQALRGAANALGLPPPVTAASSEPPAECRDLMDLAAGGQLPAAGWSGSGHCVALLDPDASEASGLGRAWSLFSMMRAGRLNEIAEGPFGPIVGAADICKADTSVMIPEPHLPPYDSFLPGIDLFEVAQRGWEQPLRDQAAAEGTPWDAIVAQGAFVFSTAQAGGATVHLWSTTGRAQTMGSPGGGLGSVGAFTDMAAWEESGIVFLVVRREQSFAWTTTGQGESSFTTQDCPGGLGFDPGPDIATWVRAVHDAAVAARLVGAVGLRATAPGYGAHDQSFANDGGLAAVEVSGVVVDDITGAPLAGATVEVLNGANATPTTSGPDGRYTLTVGFPGGSGTGTLVMDFRLPPLSPGLAVDVAPAFLSAVGDSARITVTLSDPTGAPVPAAPVRLAALSTGAAGAEGTTDADGRTTFEVYHLDAALTQYRFRVEGNGLQREVLIPVAAIAFEANPATGAPHTGVVADGVSTLRLEVSVPGLPGGELTARAEQGSLRREGADQPLIATEIVPLSEAGTAVLAYTPPEYLTEPGALQPTPHSDEGQAWGIPDTVTVTLQAPDGTEAVIPVEVRAYRPPVMLVHGFIGTADTWAAFDDRLRQDHFDTQRGQYFGADPDDIPSQAAVLGQNITRRLQAYALAGIKAGRVDLVGHSMGGLISRFHVLSTPEPGVRKVIMVATPNHGIGPVDEGFAEIAAGLFGSHDAAADQLYWDSDFLRVLNAGEASGVHLRADVEYASLFGAWSLGSKEALVVEAGAAGAILGGPVLGALSSTGAALLLETQSDGVVTTGSARLNGVESRYFSGVCHSPALPAAYCSDPAVTLDPRIWQAVEEYLLQRIYPADLAASSMEVRFTSTAEVRDYGEEATAWRSLGSSPAPLATWQILRTGPDGRATISLRIGGAEWGRIDLDTGAEVLIDYALPQQVRLWHRAGRIRLSTRTTTGDFEVQYAADRTGPMLEVRPRARVAGLGTEFALDASDPIHIEVMAGLVYADTGPGSPTAVLVEADAAATIAADGTVAPLPTGSDPWWEAGFYQDAGGSRLVWMWAIEGAVLLAIVVSLILFVRARLLPQPQTAGVAAAPTVPSALFLLGGVAAGVLVALVVWLLTRAL